MPDVLSNEDLNVLAAEYVLGTLDHEERKGASALLEVDAVFRGNVRIWEKRFGELHLMVESVQPEPRVWDRIRPKTGGVEQMPPAIPSVAGQPPAPVEEGADAATPAPATDEVAAPSAEPAAAEPAAETEADRELAELAALLPVTAERDATAPAPPDEEPAVQADAAARGFVPPPPMMRRSVPAAQPTVVRKGGRGWMAASLMMALVAIGLAGLIGAWRFFPERLPARLDAHTVLKMPVPPPPPPPPPAKPQLPPFDE